MEKVKGLKILQITVVVIFSLLILLGVIFVIAGPEKIYAYGTFMGIVSPILLVDIACALFGRPLTDLAAGVRARLETGKPAADVPQVPAAPPAGG